MCLSLTRDDTYQQDLLHESIRAWMGVLCIVGTNVRLRESICTHAEGSQCVRVYRRCTHLIVHSRSSCGVVFWKCARVKKPAVCVCVTRRLVPTGGGKQDDLYSFDQPPRSVWGREGGVSRKVKRRRSSRICALPGVSICFLTAVNISTYLSELPQPAARFPGCRRCWYRGGRLSPFAWKWSAPRPGTLRSSAESGWAPGWSRCPPQIPAASPRTTNYPTYGGRGERRLKSLIGLRFKNPNIWSSCVGDGKKKEKKKHEIVPLVKHSDAFYSFKVGSRYRLPPFHFYLQKCVYTTLN